MRSTGVRSKRTALQIRGVPSPPRGRIVLFHGLNQTAGEFQTDPIYGSLVTGLRSQSFEVIVPVIPGDGPGTDQSDHLLERMEPDWTGALVKSDMLTHYDFVRNAIADDGAPLYLGGISWGGLHVAQIAGNRTVDGFFMHLPALDPGLLTEFSSIPGDMSTLATFDTTAIAAIPSIASRGWCSYADDDNRVGHVAQPAFIAATGCTAKHYVTLGHTTNATTVTDMLTFTAALP